MTHTENLRERHSGGDLTVEVLEIDISSLDAAGQENSVSPSHIDVVKDASASVPDTQGSGDFVANWNETGSHLHIFNATGNAPNNYAVNTTRVTWWGLP